MSNTKKSTYFISDLHLDASRPKIAQAFSSFIKETAPKADAIYILGDLFDSWIGDDHSTPFITTIKQAIKNATLAGAPVFFMSGNRDFLVGQRFAEDTGCTLLDEGTLVDLYDCPAILLHGDSLCTADAEYMKFREKVRNPQWQKKMLRYPLFARRLIAFCLRTLSQKRNQKKDTEIMDVSPLAVEQCFQKAHHQDESGRKVSLMIHGHTHRPARHKLVLDFDNSEVERVVLGDWETFGWYFEVSDNGRKLVKFRI